jgi:hypothetical protein
MRQDRLPQDPAASANLDVRAFKKGPIGVVAESLGVHGHKDLGQMNLGQKNLRSKRISGTK